LGCERVGEGTWNSWRLAAVDFRGGLAANGVAKAESAKAHSVPQKRLKYRRLVVVGILWRNAYMPPRLKCPRVERKMYNYA